MNLALFSELQLDDSTIKQYTLLVPSEITFTKCDSNTVTWPFSGLLSKRLWGSDIDDAQRLEVWSKHTFTEPSLVYVQFEFFPMGTSKVPVNGITIGKACFVCICFNSSDTPNVPVDVIQRTTIHELGHLAQTLTGDFEGLDSSNHCRRPGCLMNSTSGVHPTRDSVFNAIRNRPTKRCSKCESVWQRAFYKLNDAHGPA